jgi:hypothetical protein
MPAPIAAPKDAPYPGTIHLSVDATDLERRIFRYTRRSRCAEANPVALYPQWLPGNHAPAGRVDKLAGLMIHANGARVEWVRDPVEVFAFHVNAPAGGCARRRLPVRLPRRLTANEGRMMMTPDMLSLQWTRLTLYPAGYFRARSWWSERPPARGLAIGHRAGDEFEQRRRHRVQTSLARHARRFADVRRRYFKRLDLDPGGAAPVHLDVVADRPELLEVKPEQIEAHRALVQQAYKLYGSHHYDHYDFLLALSDQMGGIGLEHHQSSEDGTVPTYFTEWDKNADSRAICCRTNTRIPGTANSGGRPTCGRRISTCRCATACCGSTKAKRSTGASCWRRARDF